MLGRFDIVCKTWSVVVLSLNDSDITHTLALNAFMRRWSQGTRIIERGRGTKVLDLILFLLFHLPPSYHRNEYIYPKARNDYIYPKARINYIYPEAIETIIFTFNLEMFFFYPKA